MTKYFFLMIIRIIKGVSVNASLVVTKCDYLFFGAWVGHIGDCSTALSELRSVLTEVPMI